MEGLKRTLQQRWINSKIYKFFSLILFSFPRFACFHLKIVCALALYFLILSASDRYGEVINSTRVDKLP